MTGAVITAVLVLVVGVPFLLLWWKIADSWADSEHKRFKTHQPQGPAPTVVKRSAVERTQESTRPENSSHPNQS